MKAVVIREHGGVETLRLEEIPAPRPGPGEALVRVRAVALNNLDVCARSGPPGGRPVFPWGGFPLPAITGGDAAGVIEEIGPGVTDFAPGDRVVVNPILSRGQCASCVAGEQTMCADYRIYGEHVHGGMAEFTLAPARNQLKIPGDVSFEHAAAAPVCFTTAWRMLVTAGRLQAGEDLLVVGASGGVGTGDGDRPAGRRAALRDRQRRGEGPESRGAGSDGHRSRGAPQVQRARQAVDRFWRPRRRRLSPRPRQTAPAGTLRAAIASTGSRSRRQTEASGHHRYTLKSTRPSRLMRTPSRCSARRCPSRPPV